MVSALTLIELQKRKESDLFVSRGRPSLLTLRGMTAPLSSLSAERVFPTELPRLMALLGVWGCGEAVSDCWGLLDVLCHLLLLLRKGNLYSNEPLSLLLPLYSDTGIRYNSEHPLWTSRKGILVDRQVLAVSEKVEIWGCFYSLVFSNLLKARLYNFYVPVFVYLRGVASSCGGIMTTRTVTVVLRRSIICSWVSVATATLQISTSRLPWRRPACQAYP